MAIVATFDVPTQTLQTRASGTVTYSDIVEHLRSERQRVPGARELFDATGANTNLTADEVKALAEEAAALFERGKVGPVAVVATDGVLFGMARMYEAFVADLAVPFHVFREVSPALEWLATRPHR
jgi:hypothetical protein